MNRSLQIRLAVTKWGRIYLHCLSALRTHSIRRPFQGIMREFVRGVIK